MRNMPISDLIARGAHKKCLPSRLSKNPQTGTTYWLNKSPSNQRTKGTILTEQYQQLSLGQIKLSKIHNCAWINWSINSLWFWSSIAWHKFHEPLARGPSRQHCAGQCATRTCKNLLQPSPLWLAFIVVCIYCALDSIIPSNLTIQQL